MNRTDDNIYVLIEEEDGFLPGWYFSDEAEQLNGPFSSRQEAIDSLNNYAKWLNGEEPCAHREDTEETS